MLILDIPYEGPTIDILIESEATFLTPFGKKYFNQRETPWDSIYLKSLLIYVITVTYVNFIFI